MYHEADKWNDGNYVPVNAYIIANLTGVGGGSVGKKADRILDGVTHIRDNSECLIICYGVLNNWRQRC